MPESIVPLVAVMAGGANAQVNAEVGTGAILGAPLMLSTLTLAVMALSIAKRRGMDGHIRPEHKGFMRDLGFFLLAYAIAGGALFLPADATMLRVSAAITLVFIYFLYVMLTMRASATLVEEGHGTVAHSELWLRRLGGPEHFLTSIAQAAVGLALLVIGARGFVHGIEQAATLVDISPLLLSLLIVPIATELPEKVNSVVWIRRGKDTLAVGNITGAMVFQGSLLPALGLTITPWRPTPEVIAAVITTYAAGLWLFYVARGGRLRVWHLMVSGTIYCAYIGAVLH